MENFTDTDLKDFSDKLFYSINKVTAGHMVEPSIIDKDNEKSFDNWVKKLCKKWFCKHY